MKSIRNVVIVVMLRLLTPLLEESLTIFKAQHLKEYLKYFYPQSSIINKVLLGILLNMDIWITLFVIGLSMPILLGRNVNYKWVVLFYIIYIPTKVYMLVFYPAISPIDVAVDWACLILGIAVILLGGLISKRILMILKPHKAA